MNSEIIMYQTEDGLTKIETTFNNDTVWLLIDQMAELFHAIEINADKPHMGVLSFKGEQPTKADALVAKHNCTEDELAALNSVVSAYLEFAEIHLSVNTIHTMKPVNNANKSIKGRGLNQ